LTDLGIYIRQDTAWEVLLPLANPGVDRSRFWSKVTINQIMFIYYQGASEVYVLEDIVQGVGVSMDVFNGMKVTPARVDALVDKSIQLFSFVPTVINVEGQVGVYKAGGSLGFWDTDDSIAWSAVSDYTDFNPSLLTLANLIKLQDQQGRITNVLPHGDGFIVYCTRSTLYVREDPAALLRFRSTVVLSGVGVAYPNEVVAAQPDTTHYAWTSMGLVQISDGKAEVIVPDFSDHVKRTRTPQYLTMLNNRYLCVGVIDPNFIPGNIDLSVVTADPGDYNYDGITVPGLVIPGYNIPGREVCLIVPEYGYEPDWNDPADGDPLDPTNPAYPEGALLDSGIKPYSTLQVYGQWLYKGASFQSVPVMMGATELMGTLLTAGSTDARYNVRPVSMDTSEIALFNSTGQVDELSQRQLDIYAVKYNETTLQLQPKWDAYLAWKAGDGASGYESLGSLGPVLASVPSDRMDGDNLATMVDGVLTYNGSRCFVDSQQNMFVNHTGYPLGLPFLFGPFGPLELNTIIPEWTTWLGTVEDGFGFMPYFWQWIGTVAQLGAYRFYDAFEDETVWVVTLENPMPRSLELAGEDVSDAPVVMLNPGAIQNLSLFNVEGGKLAYRVATTLAWGYEINQRRLIEPHRILRGTPSSLTYEHKSAPLGPTRSIVNGFIYANNAVFVGEIFGRAGTSIVATKDVAQVMSIQNSIAYSVTVTADSILSEEDAAFTVATQRLNARNASYQLTLDALIAEVASIAATEEALMLAQPGVDNVIWNESNTLLPPGAGNTEVKIPTIHDTSNVAYAARALTETNTTEVQKDFVEVLYGRTPDVLPPIATGATAIRQMEEETKRGLIAVYEHFYSTNRNRYVLDDSFLIPAAGRVEVPLGAALGSPASEDPPVRFTDKANWANRFYLSSYGSTPPPNGWPVGPFYPPLSVTNPFPTVPWPPTDTRGWEIVQQSVVCGVTNTIDIPDIMIPPIVYDPWVIENPPITWVLQNGAIAPYNPTMYGAYVYDLHLQKWGIFKGSYKQLVDYQPVNSYSPGSVSYKNFLIEGGCLTDTLEVALFNDFPTDNYLKYGKFQHISSEFCGVEQVILGFHKPSTGLVSLQVSLDGRSPEYGYSAAEWFKESLSHTLNCDIVGKWATVTLTGHYDLSSMQIKSNPAGRR
jgi:hypothetical protein